MYLHGFARNEVKERPNRRGCANRQDRGKAGASMEVSLGLDPSRLALVIELKTWPTLKNC